MSRSPATASPELAMDFADTAAAWAVRRVAGDRWAWSAWSDWIRAEQGASPEVQGIAPDAGEAASLAIAAARSMNLAGCIRIAPR